MNRRPLYATAYAAAFVGCILAANHVTTEFGRVPVWFGLTATAGTYFAGLAFVLRDNLQDALTRPGTTPPLTPAAGKNVTRAVILAGAVLSFVVSAPAIAFASAAAFGVSEMLDLAVYSPLRDRGGYVRAGTASNIVGTVVDSLVFLTIAGFPLWESLPGQIVGKLSVTAVTMAIVLGVRYTRTRSLTTA